MQADKGGQVLKEDDIQRSELDGGKQRVLHESLSIFQGPVPEKVHAACMCAQPGLKGASLSPPRNRMMAATEPKQSIIKEHKAS